MFKKLAIAALAATVALPVAAQTVPQGNTMLSQIEGVEPGVYSVADLTRIGEARKESSQAYEVDYILNSAGQDYVSRSTADMSVTTPGREQLANLLNVNAADFSLSQLVQLQDAVKHNDSTTVTAILQSAGVTTPTSQVIR